MSGCTAFADKAALAEHAAAQWLERLAKRDAGRPFTVALSGGRTPRLLYESVVAMARPSAFDNVHFFWGDERVVPPTDDESNFKLGRPWPVPAAADSAWPSAPCADGTQRNRGGPTCNR